MNKIIPAVLAAILIAPTSLILHQAYADSDAYDQKVSHAISKMVEIANKTKELGRKLINSNMTSSQVETALERIQKQMEGTELPSDIKVPQNFRDAHAHLILSMYQFNQSLNSLISTFKAFDKVAGGRLPLPFAMTILGASNPRQLDLLEWSAEINETEKKYVQEAKTSYNNSVIEESPVMEQLGIFMAESGGAFNTTSYSKVAHFPDYYKTSGCGCSIPFRFVLDPRLP